MKRTKEALVIIEKLRLDFPKSIRPRNFKDWRWRVKETGAAPRRF
jgi:hypothetical protein